ncbi:MAG: hypothetical protein IH809_01120, partial [Proteobacteria bacterium]|nr:hypothetical protein [Pseudomonadota bacterium]
IFRDSVIYFDGKEIHFWTRVECSDQTGTIVIYPGFTPGAIKVMIATDINDEFDNILPTAYELAQNYQKRKIAGPALELARQVKTLTLPGEMGEVFKAIAFTRGLDIALLGFAMRDFSDRL